MTETSAAAKLSGAAADLALVSPGFDNPYLAVAHDEGALAGMIRSRITAASKALFEACAMVAARSDHLRRTVPHGQQWEAFQAFCAPLGLDYDQGRMWVRIYHLFPDPEWWNEFAELEWQQILTFENRSHLPGQTPEERRELVLRMCRESLSHLHSRRGSRRLAEEVREQVRQERALPVRATISDLGRDSADHEPERTTVPAHLEPPPAAQHDRTGQHGIPAEGAFVAERTMERTDGEAADAQLRADVLRLQQELATLQRQVAAFGTPLEPLAVAERVREGLSLEYFRTLALPSETAARAAQMAETKLRQVLAGYRIYPAGGAA